jgi:hypothetical protein
MLHFFDFDFEAFDFEAFEGFAFEGFFEAFDFEAFEGFAFEGFDSNRRIDSRSFSATRFAFASRLSALRSALPTVARHFIR